VRPAGTRVLDRRRLQPDRDRPDRGQHDAHRAEEDERAEEWIEPRPRIPREDGLDHRGVDERYEPDGHPAERDRADEEQRLREPVANDPAEPVAC